MASAVMVSADALARARDGDHERLAGELADRVAVADGVEEVALATGDLVAALAATEVVARCLLAASDGLRRLDLHGGDGVALLLDGHGGDPTEPAHGLVATQLDPLVHLVVEWVGLEWHPPTPPVAFRVDDTTDVPTSVLDYPGSRLAARLPPTVDPARLRWWSLQFPATDSVAADELTVLDAHRAGLFLQDGGRLEPTTSADVWRRLWLSLPG